jgi:phosphoglycolate phosphatase-like HAD superfamily hydrolase
MLCYKTLIFDFDGVLINSNHVKSRAFYELACQFGRGVAREFREFHENNLGISRFIKIKYLVNDILPRHGVQVLVTPENLLTEFRRLAEDKLLRCEIDDSIFRLREKYRSSNWIVVSASESYELRKILSEKRLTPLFDGGVFGSPETKTEIFKKLLARGAIEWPAIYLGDSPSDHMVSRDFGLDFRFVTRWTGFLEWRAYCGTNNVRYISSIADLL